MVPPWKFDVGFHLQNAHMKMNREVQHSLAQKQWCSLVNILTQKLNVNVLLCPPAVGCLDMVFAANGGLARGNKVYVSRFKAAARTPETPAFLDYFKSLGFESRVSSLHFEGQGDALFSHTNTKNPLLWIGHGTRTDPHSHDEVCEFFGMENNLTWDPVKKEFINKEARKGVNAFPLKLVSDEFYHLDTCLCPLDAGNQVLYYPPAFTEKGNARIQQQFGADNCIAVSKEDALAFACNAISIGDNIVMNKATDALKVTLKKRGYNLYENPMSEFLLSGGSTKCCVMHLDWSGDDKNWYKSLSSKHQKQ